MTLRERALHNPLNEIPLPLCIRLAKGKLPCAVLTCKATLEFIVFACSRGVFAQVIPKCQRALLLFSPRLNDVHMMRVWPIAGPMEEGTERIVGVGYVNVPELSKLRGVSLDWVKPLHRDLNVDDRLRRETWDRG